MPQRSTRTLACLALALPLASAHAQQSGDAAVIEDNNRRTGAAVQSSSVLGQGTGGTDYGIPDNPDRGSSGFWVPAPYLRTGASRPLLPRAQDGFSLPQDDMPWSFQWWPSEKAHLAMRESYDQSPLEKLDTWYGNEASGSADATAVARASRYSALWEANPDNLHNTAAVTTSGGEVEKRWISRVEQVSGIRVEGGGTAVSFQGREYPAVKRVEMWQNTPIDTYFYQADVPAGIDAARWGIQGGKVWNRFVRVPSEQYGQGQAPVWWHVWYVNRNGQLIQDGRQVSGVTARSSTTRLTWQNRPYEVVEERQNWQGTPIEVFYYRAERTAGSPEIPGSVNGAAWNRFVLIPARGVQPGPDGIRWYNVRWEYSGRQAGLSWEGHCMGYAAAAILFKEPPARKDVTLRHRKKLRLKARTAVQAYRENLDAYLVEDGPGQLSFTNRDLKGIATELAGAFETSFDYPARKAPYSWADFGTKVDASTPQGSAAWDDIKPHHLHRILIDFVKERRRSVALDITRDERVFNMAAVAYSYEATAVSGQGGRPYYDVYAQVHVAQYGSSDDQRGTQTSALGLTFRIFLDERNRVIDSQWTGTSAEHHPDFVWVPVRLARPQYRFGRYDRNPQLDDSFILSRLLVDGQNQSLLRDFARR